MKMTTFILHCIGGIKWKKAIEYPAQCVLNRKVHNQWLLVLLSCKHPALSLRWRCQNMTMCSREICRYRFWNEESGEIESLQCWAWRKFEFHEMIWAFFFFPNWHLHLKWLNNIKLIRHFYDLVCTIIVNIFKIVFCEKCLRPQVVLLCLLLCSSSVFYLNRKNIYSLKKIHLWFCLENQQKIWLYFSEIHFVAKFEKFQI